MIGEQTSIATGSVEEVQEAIRALPRLLPRGGGSKPALSGPFDAATTALDVRGISGIVEYDPGEYTITVRAGTTLAEIVDALAAHGQYLPFDPPMIAQGATIGGTIAAGLSGARRYRYGGLRDFLIGIRFVDGQGRLVRGGGKVVKNAAGFDLPKLMIGSIGRLGVLTEASFKVFPDLPAFATLRLPCRTLAEARSAALKLSGAPLDIEAIDILAGGEHALLVRIGGMPALLAERLDRVQTQLGGGAALPAEDEGRAWQEASEYAWAGTVTALVKVPVTPHTLLALDSALEPTGARRRYSAGGHLAWVAWPRPLAELDALLARLGLSGLALRSASADTPEGPLLGLPADATVLARVQGVLDPAQRFLRL